MHVWKRRQDESVTQIRRARGHLSAADLQERSLLLGFAVRYGPACSRAFAERWGLRGSHALVPFGGIGRMKIGITCYPTHGGSGVVATDWAWNSRSADTWCTSSPTRCHSA